MDEAFIEEVISDMKKELKKWTGMLESYKNAPKIHDKYSSEDNMRCFHNQIAAEEEIKKITCKLAEITLLKTIYENTKI